MTLLIISSNMILSHSSLIARRNSSLWLINPRFLSLDFTDLQIVLIEFKSGDSRRLRSYFIPKRSLPYFIFEFSFPRVLYAALLSSRSIYCVRVVNRTLPSCAALTPRMRQKTKIARQSACAMAGNHSYPLCH